MSCVSAGNYIMHSRTSPGGGLGSRAWQYQRKRRGREKMISRFIPKNWARFREFTPEIGKLKENRLKTGKT